MMVSDSIQSTLDSQQLEIISVRDFFQRINWYGKSLLALDDAAVANTPYETVGQFFGTFPWQGSTAAVPANAWNSAKDDEVVSIENDTLTLEDLSALF